MSAALSQRAVTAVGGHAPSAAGSSAGAALVPLRPNSLSRNPISSPRCRAPLREGAPVAVRLPKRIERPHCKPATRACPVARTGLGADSGCVFASASTLPCFPPLLKASRCCRVRLGSPHCFGRSCRNTRSHKRSVRIHSVGNRSFSQAIKGLIPHLDHSAFRKIPALLRRAPDGSPALKTHCGISWLEHIAHDASCRIDARREDRLQKSLGIRKFHQRHAISLVHLPHCPQSLVRPEREVHSGNLPEDPFVKPLIDRKSPADSGDGRVHGPCGGVYWRAVLLPQASLHRLIVPFRLPLLGDRIHGAALRRSLVPRLPLECPYVFTTFVRVAVEFLLRVQSRIDKAVPQGFAVPRFVIYPLRVCLLRADAVAGGSNG